MKKAYLVFVLMLVLTVGIAAAVAVNNGVGNPDQECIANGFDFGIAKWEWDEEEDMYFLDTDFGHKAGYTTNVWGTNNVAYWTSNPAADGVISKEALNTYVYPGGNEGNITQAGQFAISHITFCGNENGNEVPEFGLIGAALVIAGAAGFLVFRRK